jgi:hypothetical protein
MSFAGRFPVEMDIDDTNKLKVTPFGRGRINIAFYQKLNNGTWLVQGGAIFTAAQTKTLINLLKEELAELKAELKTED